MASSSKASSSSSHKQGEDRQAFSGIEPPQQRRNVSESSTLYDVFINHRGPDVKQTLALPLYKSLENLNIRAFLDSEEKQLGVSFTSTIETAISSAAVHIAIFSKGYAESAWCLEELALMLRSKAMIIPVFYGVEPSALRYIEKGVYGKAFTGYEKNQRYMEKLGEWKEALRSISFIGGEVFNSDCENIGGEVFNSGCEKIVSAVEEEVQRMRGLYVAKHSVGLPELVERLEKKCISKLVKDIESQCGMNTQRKGKGNVVGILGMGGVGKTTLSKELFDQKLEVYRRSCFLFDVREACVQKQLPSLQMKLLREIFKEKGHASFTNVEEGKRCLRNRFARSKNLSFLIVLDDIDHQDQLEDLSFDDMRNKSGNSLVVVTTRDAGVLKNAGIEVVYEMKGMDMYEANQLFCWHAFNQPYPSRGYEELVDLFVGSCHGLPLSLQVLGRHVHGEDKKFWKSELEKAEKTLPEDIDKKLRISIDKLEDPEKQIFIDVACFFIGELTTDAIGVWEASGWNAQHALRRLKNKCLVEEIEAHKFRERYKAPSEYSREEGCVLRMHDHLRDLGRGMANDLVPRRLWRPQHLESLNPNIFENIHTQHNIRCLHSFRDPSADFFMKYFIGKSESMAEAAETSTALIWLKLDLSGQKLTNIPPWIPVRNLEFLSIFGGSLERMWQNNKQEPFALKDLRISSIFELKMLSMGFLCYLKKFIFHKIWHLGSPKRLWQNDKQEPSALKELRISSISELKELSLGFLCSLVKITVSNCCHLKSMTGITDLANLVELNISNCGELEELSLVRHSCLEKVTIFNSVNLQSVTISCFEKLVELEVRDCKRIEELSLVELSCVKKITISSCEIKKLSLFQLSCPEKYEISYHPHLMRVGEKLEIKNCPTLENISMEQVSFLKLKIEYCPKLKKISLVQVSFLENVTISGCHMLKSIAEITDMEKLVELKIRDCQELEEFSLDRLKFLEKVRISNSLNLQTLTITHLEKLIELHITWCEKIKELNLVQLSRLEKITLPTTLIKLNLQCCRELQTVEGIYDSTEVEELYIIKCPELELDELCLAQLSLLKTIAIDSCGRMQKITGIEKLHSLEGMQLFYLNNETVHNCILKMEKLPSDFIQVIGRAVDGAESILEASFFCDENISPTSVIEISTDHICPDDTVSAIILCAVVVVTTTTAADTISKFIGGYDQLKFEMRQGEWLITSVITNEDKIHDYIVRKGYQFPFDYVFTQREVTQDVMVMKGYKVTVPGRKGENHGALNVLRRIVKHLYYK